MAGASCRRLPGHLAALALLLAGCATLCTPRGTRVHAPPGLGMPERVMVEVESPTPCRIGKLDITLAEKQWFLSGSIKNCRCLHQGSFSLAVEAMDAQGKVVGSSRGAALCRPRTRRHHRCPRARFRLPIPAPDTFDRLQLIQLPAMQSRSRTPPQSAPRRPGRSGCPCRRG